MTSTTGRVVVVGSLSVDYFTYSPRLPVPGETLVGDEFMQDFGGKGANQAVAASCAARFMSASNSGSSVVHFVGSCGRDELGVRYEERLRTQDGVDTSNMLYPTNADGVGVRTGTATINVGRDTGENSIVIVAGANGRLDVAHVEQALAKIQLTPRDVVVCQLEVPREATMAALRCGRAAGALTLLNPAPARLDMVFPKGAAGESAADADDDDMLSLVDVLVPNETEAALLVGKKLNLEDSSVTLETVARSFAETLLNRGSRVLLITLGAQGVLFCTKQAGAGNIDGEDSFRTLLVPAPKVKAVDTSGAGDCFIGTLASGLALQTKHASSLQLFTGNDNRELALLLAEATVAAASSVTRAGTQHSYARAALLAEPELRASVEAMAANARQVKRA